VLLCFVLFFLQKWAIGLRVVGRMGESEGCRLPRFTLSVTRQSGWGLKRPRIFICVLPRMVTSLRTITQYHGSSNGWSPKGKSRCTGKRKR